MDFETSETGCAQCASSSRASIESSTATSSAASFLALVLAVLPSFSCPACIAAYAGLLSSAGLGFVLYEPVLQPMISVVLLTNLAALVWTARSHRSLGPLIIAAAGTLGVAGGRLFADVPLALYAGAGALFVAAAWNLWLKRPASQPVGREAVG